MDTFIPDRTPIYERPLTPYELNAKTRTINFKDRGVEYSITVRRPLRGEVEQRERMLKIVKKRAKKVDDDDAVVVYTDDARSRVWLVTTITTKVKGYKLSDGDDPELELDAQQLVDGADYFDADFLQKWKGKRDDQKQPVIRLIDVINEKAGSHILHVYDELSGGSIEVDKKKGEVLTLRHGREGKVFQRFGQTVQEDGTRSDPTSEIVWRFKSGSGEAVARFENQAFIGTTVVHKDGGQTEERRASLDTIEKLFDTHVLGCDGATVDGKPSSECSKEEIAGATELLMKRTLVTNYFASEKVDAGE